MFRALLPVSLVAAALLGAPTAVTTTAAPGPAPRVRLVATSGVAADLKARLQHELVQGTASSISAAVDVDGLGAVLRWGSSTGLPPASTEKLFTTFAALQALSPTAHLQTQVRADYAPRGSYLPGRLYLVAGGDPYLTTPQLDRLAAAVRSAGIVTIGGPLVVDDRLFDTARRAPGWKTSYVPDESGPLSALAVDRNGWRKDATYLADPGTPTVERFRTLLARRGVTVRGGLYRAAAPGGARVLARYQSGTVAELVRRTNKDSVNFAAELLLKQVGSRVRHLGSTGAGVAAVHDVLGPLGVGIGTMTDGSGLSTRDRQTASQELSLLAAAERSPSYTALRDSLPVACVDGTLQHRMCQTAAAGKARAKTGTLPGVYALTGWTTTADGHRVRFALELSGARSGTQARAALDRCVVLLSAVRTG
ncbi:MAG: D-alanyl-D-alanine carboxypeptidase/D-alanyl-D-alanine-endopeptidase [Mycobacteriales bacterium]